MVNPAQMMLPEKLAVMVLPGATLFPHSILPLFIFEDRYRAMVADALGKDRMFCVAQLRPGVPEGEGNDSFFQVGGAGVIRVCRGNCDGTSHLILQGIARVRFTDYDETKPYRYACVEPILTRIEDPPRVCALRRRMDALCTALAGRVASLSHIAAGLRDLKDTEAAADIVSGACITCPIQRQELLGEEVLDHRLDRIVVHLKAALAGHTGNS